jgi:uncharacterized membrane protein YccF (DUF307 family)
MRFIGNVIWFALAGFWLAIAYVIAAVLQAITIIQLPFAVQSLKLAGYVLWPFGRVVVDRPRSNGAISLVGNVLWLVFGGLWLALGHLVAGVLLCLTVIGIPLGIASIKMVPLALLPFGKVVVRAGQVPRDARVVASVR